MAERRSPDATRGRLDDALLLELEAHAIKLARGAGQVLWQHFRQPLDVQFKSKNNRDPVTTADRLCHNYLNSAILDKFPSHVVLSEESETPPQSGSPFVWVVDPLDGTVNFMNGLPLFASSIGVLWDGRPVAGAIWVAFSHSGVQGVYHARLGGGAFFNEEKIQTGARPTGRPLCEVPAGLAGMFSYSRMSKKEAGEARNLGSMALEYCLTASGILQYTLYGRPRLWDVAAGLILLKEAGGLSLSRNARGKGWLEVERIEIGEVTNPEAWDKLRKWTVPLVVGTAETARRVSQELRLRRSPLKAIMRWVRRRAERKSSGAK